MKNLLYISLFFVTLTAFAQDDDKDRFERIKALKVSFLTEQLELTPGEAQKFWPVYNSYDSQMDDLRTEERELYKQLYSRHRERNSLTEEQAKVAKEKYLELTLSKWKLQKALMTDLEGKIPNSKIIFIPEAERDFGKKLFEEYKKRKAVNNDPTP